MNRIGLDTVVVGDEPAAVAALEAVGATWIPALTLAGQAAELGPFVRRFGVVWQLPAAGPVRATLEPLLRHPANASLAAALREGRARHVAGSRRVAEDLAARLPAPVHLPWALRPLNMDFAGVVEDWADGAHPPFGTFFSQNIELDDDGVTLRRVFSLPVRGSAEGTMHDPPYAETLDADVGLLLEVDAAR
jgi:hypothetical protein